MDKPEEKYLFVDQPIINSPYEEPKRHWVYDKTVGEPKINPFRRSAHYYLRNKNVDPHQLDVFADQEMVELGEVNRIRNKVRDWRENGYKGITPVTRQLLRYWTAPERERKLFFCQIEAAETLIYIKEISDPGIPQDTPNEEDFSPLPRYCLKMATGSGKTLVMAMLIAWSVINKVHNRQKRWCSDAILIIAPNLTVSERLGGAPKNNNSEEEYERALIPGAKGNYYEKFHLVPPSFTEHLGRAKIQITNWHKLAVSDDAKKRHITQRGKESPQAFSSNVLKKLGSAKNILVINDEAHHAYRPAPVEDETLSYEEKKEKEEATIWVSGLDMIHSARRISTVLDLTATPFYIQSSGHQEGTPFPWIVSDFGLVDAIESGIVKIPQVPVESNSGKPEAEYYHLWKWINEKLPASERSSTKRKPKPESILRLADGALTLIAAQWKQKFEKSEKKGIVPPVLIIVCDNTDIAQLFHEHISGEKWEEYTDEKGKKQKRKVYGTGRVFPELLGNTESKEYTVRIDSKLLNETEEGKSKENSVEILRKKISTVGKQGEPGQDIRCVVSVAMLTEGWDAQNVTQILGIRAFTSHLLCEQVVGRGLRRQQYDDMTIPEYVDVYGIPFQVIPVRKKDSKFPSKPGKGKGNQNGTTLVQALDDRKHMMIEFPRVEGFIYQIKSYITADVQNIEPVKIDPNTEPTQTIVCVDLTCHSIKPSLRGPGEPVNQTREAFYNSIRPQQIYYEIARQITDVLMESAEFRMQARQQIFPQVLEIVRQYAKPLKEGGRIDYTGVDQRELGVLIYVQRVVERLSKAIRPDKSKGEAPLLPRLERFRPKGSTEGVLFRTSKDTKQTIKSHVNYVVLDSSWERQAAHYLETNPIIKYYVKNDHLDFTIPYEFNGSQHLYYPDFIIRLTNNKIIVLEIKGQKDEASKEKKEAGIRWCEAVSAWGKMGVWKYIECTEPHLLNEMLSQENL